MPKTDPRVDAYIEKSADFAKPVLSHLRRVVHEACPEVEETMKWSFPHFMYKGMLASMASFKSHCAFGFWKAALVMDGGARNRDAMGHLGRITSVSDLPSKAVLKAWVKKAAALNESGVKVERKPKAPPNPLRVPPALTAALKKHAKARAAFDALSPSHRREYAAWIAEAKTDATRDRRVATTVEWVAEGKSRNWKYER